jgi:hypothetical protein
VNHRRRRSNSGLHPGQTRPSHPSHSQNNTRTSFGHLHEHPIFPQPAMPLECGPVREGASPPTCRNEFFNRLAKTLRKTTRFSLKTAARP